MDMETIQEKANKLRKEIELIVNIHNITCVQSVEIEYCYELIAAAFGFNCSHEMFISRAHKEELLSLESYLDKWKAIAYDSSVHDFIEKRIMELNGTNLDVLDSDWIISAVQWCLTPLCKDCQAPDYMGCFIGGNIYWGITPEYVCSSCSRSANYDYCRRCTEDLIYPASEINSTGECLSHSDK